MKKMLVCNLNSTVIYRVKVSYREYELSLLHRNSFCTHSL